MRAEASWGIDALRSMEPLGVRWTEQLPAAMRVLLVSEPPRLLINAGWWRRAAGGERRQALDALCYGPQVARSDLQLWGRRPLHATGLLRHTLDNVPGEFWDRLVRAPCPSAPRMQRAQYHAWDSRRLQSGGNAAGLIS